MNLPNRIACGNSFPNGHVQGIAVDPEKGHVYYCFTTILVKTDLRGHLIGTVEHLAGHMGCITFDGERRRVYGSLELKHDVIGRGIIRNNGGWDPSSEDSFYLASFDIDRIDRIGMNAETDGIMKAVYLWDVVRDYREPDEACGLSHRYGCSGIDGCGLGPVFGAPADSRQKLMIAYGIYSEPDKKGNDYQVILQFDPDTVDRYGRQLCQETPHHSGPDVCEKRYFLYTGNTNFGIQNLEYDPCTGNWIVAVYTGKKPEFPNYPMFFIDGAAAPKKEILSDRAGETGEVLTLAKCRESGEKIPGFRFPFGQTGICSCKDGTAYFSQPSYDAAHHLHSTTLVRYRYNPDDANCFTEEKA